MIGVYLTNLRKYNDGVLDGAWLELPMDGRELKKKFKELIGDDDEYFITDYDDEYGFGFGEYEDIFKLNDLLSQVEDFNLVAGIMEWKGFDLQEAIEEQENYEFIPDMSGEEYEEELMEDCYGNLHEKLGWMANYVDVDYEAMARDDDAIYEYKDGIIRER